MPSMRLSQMPIIESLNHLKYRVNYTWISTPKSSSKGEASLTYLYNQQPENLSNAKLQTNSYNVTINFNNMNMNN